MILSPFRQMRPAATANRRSMGGHGRSRDSRAGFSLSEIVISLGIIGAVTVTLLGVLGTSLIQGGSARLSQEATLAARHVLAELQVRAAASLDGGSPLSTATLAQEQWFFGPGLQPLPADQTGDALYRVTLEFPTAPSPAAPGANQQAPGMNPLQPVEIIVRHPWRGAETPDQREDRLIAQLRL